MTEAVKNPNPNVFIILSLSLFLSNGVPCRPLRSLLQPQRDNYCDDRCAVHVFIKVSRFQGKYDNGVSVVFYSLKAKNPACAGF
jgi:hypothetical protein